MQITDIFRLFAAEPEPHKDQKRTNNETENEFKIALEQWLFASCIEKFRRRQSKCLILIVKIIFNDYDLFNHDSNSK